MFDVQNGTYYSHGQSVSASVQLPSSGSLPDEPVSRIMRARKLRRIEGNAHQSLPCPGHTFTHTPMRDASKQIRLLTFKSGASGYENLSISTWNMDDVPEYTALSYTWDPVELRRILINGLDFDVRINCHYALWQANLHVRTAYIWVDSICINQKDDLHEKNAQVNMMYKIYRRAKSVVSCIGRHQDGSERLIAIMSGLGPLLIGTSKNGRAYRVKAIYRSLFAALGTQEFENLVQMLESLEARPYWRRLWILQEIYAGRPNVLLLCGQHCVAISLLQILVSGVHLARPELAEEEARHFPYISGVTYELQVKPSLASIFNRFGINHLCSDPRDRLFGLKALMRRKGSEPDIKVDYNKTPLQLAVEIMPTLDDEKGIKNMLAALELTCRNDEIQSYVREQSAASGLVDKSFFATGKVETSVAAVLSSRDGEILTADFYRAIYDHDQALANALARHCLTGKLRVPSKLQKASKPVMCGNDVAALVTTSAQPGDLLFMMNSLGPDFEHYMVLRRSSDADDVFDVIGQGVGLYGYHLGLDKVPRTCQCSPSQQLMHTFHTDFSLHMSAGDVLAYHAQDFTRPSGQIYYQELEGKNFLSCHCLNPSVKGSNLISSTTSLQVWVSLSVVSLESKSLPPSTI